MSDDFKDPDAFLALSPEQYPMANDALEFLNSQFEESGIGPRTQELLRAILGEEPESVGQNAINLAFGMMIIASFLVRLRDTEHGRTPAQTIEYLRRVCTPPPPGE